MQLAIDPPNQSVLVLYKTRFLQKKRVYFINSINYLKFGFMGYPDYKKALSICGNAPRRVRTIKVELFCFYQKCYNKKS